MILHKLHKKILGNNREIQTEQLKSLFKKYHDYTMVPEKTFVLNLNLVHQYLKNVEGDVAECGVWKGGMSAALAEILGNNRTYFLLDSFEGLPEVKAIDGIAAKKWQQNTEGEMYYDNCRASITDATKAMSLANCNYEIIQGWFEKTLPVFAPEKKIALLRLDCDWYDSTIICLRNLYPKLVMYGMVLIDDYFAWDGCSRAVHDYLSEIKSTSRIRTFGDVCFIIKTDEGN